MQKDVSQTTSEQYLSRAKTILADAAKWADVDTANTRQITDYLLSLRDRLSKSSWRSYRAAVNYYLKENHPEDAAKAAEELSKADLSICPPPTQTSAARKKHIDKKQLATLIEHLSAAQDKQHKSGLPRKTLFLLTGGIVTGIRPSEWESGVITHNKDGQEVFRVITKKQRGKKDKTRDIKIVDELHRYLIEENLKMISLWVTANGRADSLKYLHKCRCHLRGAVKKLFGPNIHVTLYDARHQYAANLKGLGISQEKIAELLGHTKIKNTSLYGSKGSSWVRPTSIEGKNRETQSETPDGQAENAAFPGSFQGGAG